MCKIYQFSTKVLPKEYKDNPEESEGVKQIRRNMQFWLYKQKRVQYNRNQNNEQAKPRRT